MRYWSYAEPHSDGTNIITVSEADLWRDYYPQWRKRMVDKFGDKASAYCFEDFLDEWQQVHWAWRVEQ